MTLILPPHPPHPPRGRGSDQFRRRLKAISVAGDARRVWDADWGMCRTRRTRRTRHLRPQAYGGHQKIRFLAAESRRLGMTTQAVCDYTVGKVAAQRKATGIVTGYGINCSVVQSIVPFGPIL
jgi:hypothetical protein